MNNNSAANVNKNKNANKNVNKNRRVTPNNTRKNSGEKTFRVPVNVTKNVNMSQYFPPAKNMTKLRITDVGLFSVSKPEDAAFITEVIAAHVDNPKKKVITDATAGVGGNTISFAETFKSVNAVERDAVHAEILENNINAYGLKNVKIQMADYTEVLGTLKQDIVFIDAPWGGKKYREDGEIKLMLSGKPLSFIANQLKKSAELIVFKVPRNFNYNHLLRGLAYMNILIVKYFKFHIVLISEPLPNRPPKEEGANNKSPKVNNKSPKVNNKANNKSPNVNNKANNKANNAKPKRASRKKAN